MSAEPSEAELRIATDEDRIAFARDQRAVVEAFGPRMAAEAGELRRATTDLLSLLVD